MWLWLGLWRSNKSFKCKSIEQCSSKCQQYMMECQQHLWATNRMEKIIIGTKWEKIENAALVRFNLLYGVLFALHFRMNYERVLFVQNHIPRMLHFMCGHLKIALRSYTSTSTSSMSISTFYPPHRYQLVRICDFPLCVDKRCLFPLYSQMPLFSAPRSNGWEETTNIKKGRRWKCNATEPRFER